MFRLLLLINIFISVVLTMRVIHLEEDDNYCYALDKSPYKYYGTKTAYELVHGSIINGRIPKCHPVQFWSINRHGTRLPGKADIKELHILTQIQKEIINNYESNAPFNGLCDEDLQLIKNWKWNTSINTNTSSFLTTQGWQDEKLLALRNKARFSDILSLPYTEEDFLFRHTRTQRTEASCKAFAEGLFGEEARNIHRTSFENDTLLETYKHCKFWQETVDENPDSLIEHNKFLASNIYRNMVDQVSNKLGYNYNEKLNESTIKTIFQMCRFEQSWYIDDKSAWCSGFTEDNLLVLEYAEDLLYYYLIGHGIPLNVKVGCMPLQDLMRRFDDAVNGKGTPKGVFYFTHSSSLQLLMAAMGLMKDELPLKGDNMKEQENRRWRTSFIDPFAANIDAVLYRCTEKEEYRVVLYINERKYFFPECSDLLDNSCSWKQFKKMFESVATNCNLDFCNNDSNNNK